MSQTKTPIVLPVEQAAKTKQYGSFSERNPMLGKMVRCPYCRIRRRENETCCTHAKKGD